jgi:hypothetical protein
MCNVRGSAFSPNWRAACAGFIKSGPNMLLLLMYLRNSDENGPREKLLCGIVVLRRSANASIAGARSWRRKIKHIDGGGRQL